jgi:hypothetical protein
MNEPTSPDFTGCVAHYTKSEYLESILGNQRVRLSKIGNFSDPRENSISWLDTTGTATALERDLKSKIQMYLKIICCVSQYQNHTLGRCTIESEIYGRPRMWSQYGDNNKGFCIIINTKLLTERIGEALNTKGHLKYGKVEYHEWLHLVNGGISLDQLEAINVLNNSENLFSALNQNENLTSIFFKKSIDWKDECEHRWLAYHPSENDLFINLTGLINGVVLGIEFPKNQFSQARLYCKKSKIPLYALNYQHPKYQILKI